MKINDIEVNGTKFAYDGCHKIYIIEQEKDLNEAISYGYEIHDIEEIEEIYKNSCCFRFIDSWDLTKFYAKQGHMAKFTY